jgi:AcrR family transcriptional regulator
LRRRVGENSVLKVQNAVPAKIIPIEAAIADEALRERRSAYVAEVRALIDAAFAVMARTGDIDPPVRDIVREAGLSNQAFYRHFRGKDELLVALLDDGRQRLLATIERRMSRVDGPAAKVRAWIDAVLAQARDPEAAAATRPFAVNGDRLAVRFPAETQASRDRLVDPLRPIVGDAAALAIYHVAMGTVHDALIARRTPSRADAEAIVEFSLRGADVGA